MKKLVSLLLVTLMMFSIVSVAPFSVGAAETEPTEPVNIIKEGSCGLSAYYTLDDKGELVVSGTGELIYYDYNNVYGYYFDVPWYHIRDTIKTVIIQNGITRINEYAFFDCNNLKSITILNPDCSICDSDLTISDTAIICGDDNSTAQQYAEKYGRTFVSLSEKTFDYTYNVLADGTAEITGYTGTDTSLTIPSKIDDYTVTSIGEGAFDSCTDLTSVTIPETVTSIREWAFNCCESLTSIDIPDSVTSIGSLAFQCCKSLTSIDIPDSVESIGMCAFSGCTGLTSIDIPDSVKSIGVYAFESCKGLTSVTFGNSVESIGELAFTDCTGLTTIEIPDSVESIGTDAFSLCTSLTSITVDKNNKTYDSRDNCNAIIKTDTNVLVQGCKNTTILDSVESIGADAFHSCSGLTSITIPDSVVSIGAGAFGYCKALTSITIPDSVTSIGRYAFYCCEALTSITIFNPDCSIYDYSYTISDTATIYGYDDSTAQAYAEKHGRTFVSLSEKTFDYTYNVLADGTAEITGYTGTDTSLTIPSKIDDYTVTSIGFGAFEHCIGLTSVDIPETVTSIGEYAFSSCIGLTSVTIPDSVTIIGRYAFSGCSGLTSIIVDKNNKNYDSRNNCNAIIESATNTLIVGCNSTIIPETVTSIGDVAFYSCRNLISINIPDSVTRIGTYAFSSCSGLTSITIPDSVTSIGEYAFSGCSGLTSVDIPETVTSIGEYAFSDCTGLTTVTIPKTVTGISSGMFEHCTGLTSVDIPDSVISIGSAAFESCFGLTSVIIPETVTSIDAGVFGGCGNLATVTILNPDCSIYDNKYTISDTATIYGYDNSTAQAYAEKHSKKFVSLGEKETEAPTEDPRASKVENVVIDSVTANTVSLSWDQCEDCFKYWVYKYSEETGEWVIQPSVRTTSAVVKNLTPNTTYKFKVTGKFLSDYAVLSPDDADVYEVTTAEPAAPTELTSTIDLDRITVSWDEVEGATKYWLYKSTSPDGPYYISGSTTTNSIVVKKLSPDTTYYFKVTSMTNQNGVPCGSSVDDSPMLKVKTLNSADISTKLISNTGTTISISWPTVDTGIKYWIKYSTTTSDVNDDEAWTTVKSVTDNSVNTYTINKLKPNTKYYVTVRVLYTDTTGAQRGYDFTPISVRTAYSDELFVNFGVVGSYLTLTWGEEENLTDIAKTWVYAYDAQGNQLAMTSTTTNVANLKLFDGYKYCYYELRVLMTDGTYGLLTPTGGERYHN